MNGIIYTRVSSDEQTKGTSLDTQEEACILYCKNKGINVVKVFREEGASAKTADRKEFLNAIDFCQKSKVKINYFIVHKLDRFSRNTASHFEVKAILSRFGVTLCSVTEPIGNDPSEKLLETIMAGFAEFDNSLRRKRCMDGMLAKLHQGYWPWKAPIGYSCAKFRKQGLKKHEADKPNPETFPIIQKALKLYADGTHSQMDILNLFKREKLDKISGNKITYQFVSKVLGKQLPFYAGLLVNPWPNESGSDALIKGLHIPMISVEEMETIQLIRTGKKRIIQKGERFNPKFPLRRTVLCACCNKPMTGSTPIGNGGAYDYYHCHNKQCELKGKTFSTKALEDEFVKHLETITPKQNFLELLKATTINTWKNKGVKFQKESEEYKAEIKVLESQRKRIFEMREDGSYSVEEFKERKAEIDAKIATVRISQTETDIDLFDLESALNYAIEQIKDLPRMWNDLKPHLKSRFQKLVFPYGIAYEKNIGFRTTKLGCIYELNQQFSTDYSTAVDARGLEPPTSSVQVRRSTR